MSPIFYMLYIINVAKYIFVFIWQCPNVSNPTQADVDADQMGNACDDDIDNDGQPNEVDLDDDEYYYTYDASAIHISDGMLDVDDVCAQDYNLFTFDVDQDGYPDFVYSYLDSNGQKFPSTTGCDNCYGIPNNQSDVDGDGYGDDCDNVKSLKLWICINWFVK